MLDGGRINFVRTERPLDDTGNEQRLLNHGNQQQPDELWVCVDAGKYEHVFGLFGERRGVYGFLASQINSAPVLNGPSVPRRLFAVPVNQSNVLTIGPGNTGSSAVIQIRRFDLIRQSDNTLQTGAIQDTFERGRYYWQP